LRAARARWAERAAPVVVAILVAGLCVSSALARGTREARAAGLRISIFGDSVLLGAADDIRAALPGDDVTIDAAENVSLLGRLATLEDARPTIGDVVVLDLGYNDGADLGAWHDRVERAADILDGVPRVIWLSQREFAPGRAEMNAELRAVAQAHPNIEVADWNALVDAQPGLVYGDGIHLTPAGRAAMAELVRQRVDAFVDAQRAATSTTATPTTTAVPTTAVPTTNVPATAGAQPRHQRASSPGPDLGDALPWAVALAALLGVVLAGAGWLIARSRRAPRRAG
jgi:hypothetical protein